MIPLILKVRIDGDREPFVVRLNSDWTPELETNDGYLTDLNTDSLVYETLYGDLVIDHIDHQQLHGDVLLVVPERGLARRLIRASSKHNTLLVTEQCDQLCVMCSQPPKKHHVDSFAYLETAIALAPQDAIIGISGGEPTLYKGQLFHLIKQSLTVRPDVSFHVLSNGQHFEEGDIESLLSIPSDKILWGIPLYAPHSALHDEIVKKTGAFDQLQRSLAILYQVGAMIELRTVVLNTNVHLLTHVASYIASHVPFVFRWAIMQLERIGYGRQNWNNLFYDNSIDFDPIAKAVSLSLARGISTQLYNFPLCTVREGYRELAPSTISDWKQRFLPICDGCEVRGLCGGFFEWYEESVGFKKLGLK